MLSQPTWGNAASSVGNSVRGLWLLKNVPPKKPEAEAAIIEDANQLKEAASQGGILGISPSVPWMQMVGEFAKPQNAANAAALIPANIEHFAGNYVNIILGGALFTIFTGHPKRTAASVILNQGLILAPVTVFDAASQALNKVEAHPFFKTVTATWLRYVALFGVQGFIVLLMILSRRGRVGLVLGNLLALAHATAKTKKGIADELINRN